MSTWKRHPRAQLDRRAGGDRRVDPLVEVDLVAGVEEDPEERVAEVAVDDRVERAAGLADPQRAVPLRDGREVRARRAARRSRGSPSGSSAASSTTNPARQFSAPQIPKRVVNRSPRSIRRSPGLSRPSVARRPGGQHQVARQRHAVPAEQRAPPRARVIPGRSPRRSRRTPFDVWQAAHSSAASCSTSLITRSPSAASISRSVAFSTEPARAGQRPQLVDEERRRPRCWLGPAYVFQPTTPTRRAGADPFVAEDLARAVATGPGAGWAG